VTALELPDEQALTPSDLARLSRLEIVIEDGLATFVKVGEALLEIRSKRLYREGFDSFEDYCSERWQMERAHAYRMMQGAEVVAVLSPIGDVPTNEAQARELAPLLKEPTVLQEAWQEVVDANPEPTAANVREVVQRRVEVPKTPEQLEAQERRVATRNILDVCSYMDRSPVRRQATREAALIDHDFAARLGQQVTPKRLRRVSEWAALLADELERSMA
jgi:hypothetical protein